MQRSGVLAVLTGAMVYGPPAGAVPTFVKSVTDLNEPLSAQINVAAGNVIVVALWGDTNTFPASVSDDVGTQFSSVGTAPTPGNGTLSGLSTQLYYGVSTAAGTRNIILARAGTSNSSGLAVFEFAGVPPINSFYWATYLSSGPPVGAGQVIAGPNALVFGEVLQSGTVRDAGVELQRLPSPNGYYFGYRAAPDSGLYGMDVDVTTSWISVLFAIGPPAVFPDAGSGDAGSSDAGSSDAGNSDAGSSGDGGNADSGTPDGGASGDAGASADAGNAPIDGGAGGGGADAGLPRGEYSVGSGCRAAGSLAPGLLLLLAAALTRRRLRR